MTHTVASREPPRQFRSAIDQAHDDAALISGTDNFGSSDYLGGLKVLLQSMDYDPRFTEQGRRIAWDMVVATLASRAHACQSMKDNPGFDSRAVTDPVVITGIPRTGTTALHRLMAVDQRFQGLQTWLLDSPMPRPPIETWSEYPQFRRSVKDLEAHYAATPEARAAHYRAAEEVHECCMLLKQSFVSNILSCGWSAATYDAWWQAQDETLAYRHFYRCVQLIGSSESDKRWLLKNPGHIEHLDLLFAVFPNVKVIQTHRDPAKAIPSLVSLLMNLHPLMEEGRLKQRGENMLVREIAKWSNAVRKAALVKQRHPDSVLDIVHADFHDDPMSVLERIYAFIDLDIPEETRARFLKRIAEKPELQHGVHRYDITDYGMTLEAAREPFGSYIQQFDLLEKRK